MPKGPPATILNQHTCLLQTPAIVPIPHAGGGMVMAGCPQVMIGGMPAARSVDQTLCTGPPPHPDIVGVGSATVMIGGMPAARGADMMNVGGGALLPKPGTVIIGG